MGTRSNPRPTPGKPVNDDLSHSVGPVSAGWLADVGVHTAADLRERGALAVWVELKSRFPGVSVNLLYGLSASLRGLKWKDLSPAERAVLKKSAAEALAAVQARIR